MEEPFAHFVKYFSDRILDSKDSLKLAKEISADLKSKMPAIKTYYYGYHPQSVQTILEQYAYERHRFTKDAAYFARTAEEIVMKFRSKAEEFIQQIQYKKLFNLQCLWRAGKITLPGVEICEDFNRWEYDIFNCPHVSVITQEEVDLMIRFLEETPVEEQYADEVPYHYDWLNYPYLKICFADREGIELDEFYQTYVLCIMDDNGIPPWYDFYDEFMYTKHLLGLTDVKFPNEIRYTRLHAQFLRDEKKKKEIAEGISQEPFRKSDPRPYLGLGMDHNKIFTDIVNNFESPITRKNFENYAAVEIAPNSEEEDLREEVDNVIDELKNIREAVPIIEHENWKQGLIISYRKYKYQKTIDAIPYAYQDYLTRIETKIPFPAPIQPFNDASLLQTKQNILAGRKLAGEPMDFNF